MRVESTFFSALSKPSRPGGIEQINALYHHLTSKEVWECNFWDPTALGQVWVKMQTWKCPFFSRVHCVMVPRPAPEDKRFITVLHKLGNKFTMIYWLYMWTWLQPRSRLESCMAGFRLEAETSNTVLVSVYCCVWVCVLCIVAFRKHGSGAYSEQRSVGTLIPQQWAVPKGRIISYSDSGSAVGILTSQQIKKTG